MIYKIYFKWKKQGTEQCIWHTTIFFTSVYEESLKQCSRNSLILKVASYGWEVDYFYDEDVKTTYYCILIYSFLIFYCIRTLFIFKNQINPT